MLLSRFILAIDQYKIPKDKNKHIVKQKTWKGKNNSVKSIGKSTILRHHSPLLTSRFATRFQHLSSQNKNLSANQRDENMSCDYSFLSNYFTIHDLTELFSLTKNTLINNLNSIIHLIQLRLKVVILSCTG